MPVPQPTAHRVLYDASDLWFPAWPLAVAGIAVGLVGVGLLRRAGEGRVLARTVGSVLAVFGPTWALVVGTALVVQHARLRAALGDGSFTLVEGVVYDRPPGDAGDASWVVESGARAHWYRYGRVWWTAGYQRRAPGSGGLHDGSQVRIADVRGRIARIEVAE